jgi:hypothetical protein
MPKEWQAWTCFRGLLSLTISQSNQSARALASSFLIYRDDMRITQDQ